MPPEIDTNAGLAAAVTEVSERLSLLVREEVELAKAEVIAKGIRIARGAGIGAAAGVFVLAALIVTLEGTAWLLWYLLPTGETLNYFWGFFFLAFLLLVLASVAGYIAYRILRTARPPVPTMAIEEAKMIREAIAPHTDVPL